MNQLPKYSDLFLPVLLVMKDGQEKSIQGIATAFTRLDGGVNSQNSVT